MPTNREKEIKKKMRVIFLVLIGGIAFSISIVMNIIGMSNALNNKNSDISGIVVFSTETKESNNTGKSSSFDIEER